MATKLERSLCEKSPDRNKNHAWFRDDEDIRFKFCAWCGHSIYSPEETERDEDDAC